MKDGPLTDGSLERRPPVVSPGYLAGKLREKGVVWFVQTIIRESLRRLLLYPVWASLHIVKRLKFITVVRVRTDRIGPFVYNTDIFVRLLELKKREGKRTLVLGIAGPIGNQQLLKMWRRKFPIIQCKPIWSILPFYPITLDRKSELYLDLDYEFAENRHPLHRYDTSEPTLRFTPAEEEKGGKLLKEIGIDDGSWFMCFYARDSVYLSTLFPAAEPDERRCRDADIKNYLEAAKYAVHCGGFALRMGYLVSVPLPELNEPRIIDYSSHYRSDFGDIYIPAKCKFYLGVASGLNAVPKSFGKSIAFPDFVSMEVLNAFSEGDIFLPKKIWSIEKKRFLTFAEILDSGVGRYNRNRHFSQAGLELINNTAQEILDLCQEMNERLDGTFEYSDEDEELQRRFHSLIKPEHLCYGTPVRMGAKFLRENQQLLG